VTAPTDGRDRLFRRNPHVSGQIRHPADGFPLIAGTVIMLGGYRALTATLLAVAALELAISAKLPTGRDRAVPHLSYAPGRASGD
jgi:hypothetical protein